LSDPTPGERTEAARRGENPAVVRRMASGWAVMCDWQRLPGYLILLADPIVPSLNDLDAPARQRFLADMALLGDALLAATDAVRVNYQILGNKDPFLHAHVCPRYAWEEPRLRVGSTALYDKSAGPFFDPARDRELMVRIGVAIDDLTRRDGRGT